MDNSMDERDRTRKRAQNHFAAAAQRDTLVRDIVESERAANTAKTAKLRALRLAKEQADREARQVTAENAPSAAKPHRKRTKTA